MIKGAFKGFLVAFVLNILGLHFRLIEVVQPYLEITVTTEIFYLFFIVAGAILLSKRT